MSEQKANVVWQGNLKEGRGQIELANGTCREAYTFASRFEEGEGTNPEAFLAAAHASCFSMALSGALQEAGFAPERIETEAQADLTPEGDTFRIGAVHLHTRAQVADIEEARFQQIAEEAKTNCPVSKALGNVAIHLAAELNRQAPSAP